MNVVHTSQISESDHLRILSIWNRVYPAFMAFSDLGALKAYLDRCAHPQHFIVRENDLLQGWLCTFDRNNGRWIVMIIDPNYQGKGIGTSLLKSAKAEGGELNAWVVERNDYLLQNGTPYRSPLRFYLKSGFQAKDSRFDDGALQAIHMHWQRQT